MDKNNIAISVIVPVYNVEEYLEECLDSVLRQSFNNYEIICVDAASTDNSFSILQRYQKMYQRIHVIQQDKTRGLSATRNDGLKVARGKYIFFLDSDDMLFGESVLKELYYLAEENETDLIYFNMVRKYVEEPLKVEKKENISISPVYTGKALFCLCAEERRLSMEACRQFCKKEFLINNNIDFYEGILHEDMLFSFLCAMKAQRVIETEQIYYIYRQRPNSIMGIRDRRREQAMYVVLSEVYSYWISHNFTKRENEAISYYFDILYNAYKRYQKFEYGYWDLDCGNYAEKYVYQLLKKDSQSMFSVQQLKQIVNSENIILYGAGLVAEDIIWYLKNLRIEIKYLAVTDKTNNPKEKMGIEVKEIRSLQEYKENSLIVIAVKEKFVLEINSYLDELGFKNVLILNYT